MNYNSEFKIGVIYNIDSKAGVGTIASSDGVYLFVLKDLDGDVSNYKKDDIVTFRAEEVDRVKRAFFVKKNPTLVLKKEN